MSPTASSSAASQCCYSVVGRRYMKEHSTKHHVWNPKEGDRDTPLGLCLNDMLIWLRQDRKDEWHHLVPNRSWPIQHKAADGRWSKSVDHRPPSKMDAPYSQN